MKHELLRERHGRRGVWFVEETEGIVFVGGVVVVGVSNDGIFHTSQNSSAGLKRGRRFVVVVSVGWLVVVVVDGVSRIVAVENVAQVSSKINGFVVSSDYGDGGEEADGDRRPGGGVGHEAGRGAGGKMRTLEACGPKSNYVTLQYVTAIL